MRRTPIWPANGGRWMDLGTAGVNVTPALGRAGDATAADPAAARAPAPPLGAGEALPARVTQVGEVRHGESHCGVRSIHPVAERPPHHVWLRALHRRSDTRTPRTT